MPSARPSGAAAVWEDDQAKDLARNREHAAELHAVRRDDDFVRAIWFGHFMQEQYPSFARALHPYLPVKFAGRCSRKPFVPSRASRVTAVLPNSSASRSSAECRSVWSPLWIRRFVAATASGPFAAMTLAMRFAS